MRFYIKLVSFYYSSFKDFEQRPRELNFSIIVLRFLFKQKQSGPVQESNLYTPSPQKWPNFAVVPNDGQCFEAYAKKSPIFLSPDKMFILSF